jgi:hypothetical protein
MLMLLLLPATQGRNPHIPQCVWMLLMYCSKLNQVKTHAPLQNATVDVAVAVASPAVFVGGVAFVVADDAATVLYLMSPCVLLLLF